MANTRAVKDPKNGVVSCWVCTFVLVVMDLLRLFMLRMNNQTMDWIFIGLIVIWLIISLVETIKYRKEKKGKQDGREGDK